MVEKADLELATRLLAIGKDCATRLSPRVKALDIEEFLYDERGLPK